MVVVLLSIASALQPLDTFVEAGRLHAIDAQLADLDVELAAAQRTEARGAWLPNVSASAGYTRNQAAVEATFADETGEAQTLTITALDQLDASARLEVPLVDVAAWSRSASASARVEAARDRRNAAVTTTAQQVTVAWFRRLAATAVEEAAAQATQTADDNVSFVARRVEAGLASELDRQRALADAARSRETLADASLEVALANRQLVVLTGIEPDGAPYELEPAGPETTDLTAWLARLESVSSVAAAEGDARAARRDRTAAASGILPTVDAFATERWTNAAGFGPNTLWSAGVQATWALDVTRPAARAKAGTSAAQARLRETAARERAETEVVERFHRITSLVARFDAAVAREAASDRAAEVAQARFASGVGSQLDRSIAERDRFQAEVNRIRAAADVHGERRLVRVLAGLPAHLASTP
jgi:outer membrane protein TolC